MNQSATSQSVGTQATSGVPAGVVWTGFKTIVIKEVTRIMRIWAQTLVPPAITMSLYFVIFGNLIGSRVGAMDGFSYIDFIVPGLVMMSVITNSYANMVSSFFGAKFAKHIEEILISPLPNYAILAGYVTGSLFRGLTVGAVVILVSLGFTDLEIHSLPVIVTVVVLTSVVFSMGGFINAVFANKFDDISIVPTFVLTPLTYLGGVFYTIDLLPPFWKAISLANPILYMVNAFRYGFLGVSDVPIWTAYGLIIVFLVLLTGVCLWLLRTGVGLRS